MTVSAQDYFWDGYLHWAGLMVEAVDGPAPALSQMATNAGMTVVEPVFVRLHCGLSQESEAVLGALRDADVSPSAVDLLSLPELAFLQGSELAFDHHDISIGVEHALLAQVPIEFFLYRPVARSMADHEAYDAIFQVIDLGAPALMRTTQASFMATTPVEVAAQPSLPFDVIGAVIDNDIGFLNSTFRHSSGAEAGNTRFQAVWLQSRECVASTPTPPINAVQVGRILHKPEIDAMIRNDPRDEVRIYADINQNLHVWEPFRSAPPMQSHGTSVADLAYGQDLVPADRHLNTPLMAVQLPPDAAVDTTGTHSESYLVQGVRWLCARARQMAPGAKLVINISYGVLAGQKDGGKFLEAQIAREVTLAQALGQSVHVVYAYGNSLNSQQVAQVQVAPGATSEPLGWTILPDDPVPNFLEIRALTAGPSPRVANLPDGVQVELISPDGTPALCASPVPGAAVPPLGAARLGAAARLYHAPARTCAGRPDVLGFYNLAIAPTVRIDPALPVAPAGEWQIVITNTAQAPVDLVLQIQRGDTAPGFDIGGRQSTFVGTAVRVVADGQPGWDVTLPLTNDGTSSAFANAAHPHIHTVSADKDVLGDIAPADYASKGAPWTGVPVASDRKVVDQVFTFGQMTVGTYSGTTARLSGSSGAAALVSRDLVAAGPTLTS
jgi:hypothetical protein